MQRRTVLMGLGLSATAGVAHSALAAESGHQAAAAPVGSLEANKQIVRDYFEMLDRTQRVPEHMCSADFKFHVAGYPEMNLEEDKVFTAMFFTAIPDLTHPIDGLIAEGDRVAYLGRYDGHHTGPFMNTTPAGGRISASGIGVMRIADGKIAELWISPDRMTLMQQLGVLPKDA